MTFSWPTATSATATRTSWRSPTSAGPTSSRRWETRPISAPRRKMQSCISSSRRDRNKRPGDRPDGVVLAMNRHHLRFVLRQYIEHKNPSNLRLHVWTNGIGWLGLTTALSQVPLPFAVPALGVLGANLGAGYAALSVLYWLPVDVLVSAGVAA